MPEARPPVTPIVPPGQGPGPMPSAWRDSIIGVAAVAFIAKLVLALRTYGTNDVLAWQLFADGARDTGVQLYATAWDFNHPPAMLWVLRLLGWLSSVSDVGFPFWLRLPAILADVGILWMVWRILAARSSERSIRWALLFLAAAPPLILISGFHGNTDPVMVFFVLLSIHMLKSGSPRWLAGAVLGLALCVKVVPVILIPMLWFYQKSLRKAVEYFLGAAVLIVAAWSPFVWQEPLLIARKVFGYGSLSGNWGIPGILVSLGVPVDESGLGRRGGTMVLLALLTVGSWWINRSEERPSLFSQAGLVFFLFLALTSGFGIQYLAWLTPWVVELGALPTAVLYATSGAFLLVVYNYWSQGIPWYLADSNSVGSWVGHLDFFQYLCWVSVVCICGMAIRRARSGRPVEYAPAVRVTVTAGLMALFTLGYQAEKDAIPLSSRTPAATKQRAMSATVFLGRSARSYGVGNYRDAIAAARHALRCQPGMTEAWNNIAASYAGLRMWDEAIAAAQEAIRLKPDFELAKNNLAWAANEKARQSEGTPANSASVPR